MSEELRMVLHDVYDILQISYSRTLHFGFTSPYPVGKIRDQWKSVPLTPYSSASEGLLDICGRNH